MVATILTTMTTIITRIMFFLFIFSTLMATIVLQSGLKRSACLSAAGHRRSWM